MRNNFISSNPNFNSYPDSFKTLIEASMVIGTAFVIVKDYSASGAKRNTIPSISSEIGIWHPKRLFGFT